MRTRSSSARPRLGTEVDTRLGKPFAVRAASSEFRRELARRIVAYNRELGERPNAPVSDEDRARLRSELGREWFLRDHGREPLDARELTDYVIGASRPGKRVGRRLRPDVLAGQERVGAVGAGRSRDGA